MKRNLDSISKLETGPTREDRIRAYQDANKVAQSACDALSALLTAKYGKRAGDMRYRKPETVEIAQAMRAKLEADERKQTAWLATMRKD